MEDQGIVALFFDRSEQAIAETDKKYGAYCYAIAYNILACREDSQECVSDTYLRAWNTIPPKKPRLLNAFLGKITRHISIDRWRRLGAKKRGGGEVTLALEELRGRQKPGGRGLPPGAEPAHEHLSDVLAGNGAKRVSVPILVPGFR